MARAKFGWQDDNDIGNARRLVDRFGQDLRYAYEPGRWYVWDGCVWRRDRSGRVAELAKEVAKGIFADAVNASGTRRTSLLGHAARSSSQRAVRAMIGLAATDERVSASVAAFDADPWSINTPAGIANVLTGEIEPHDRARLMSRMTRASGRLDAACPATDAVLDRAFGGSAELIEYFWRAVGYSMLGTTREQVMFICHGRGGNGKSTVIDAIVDSLGDYAATSAASTFVAKDRERGGPEPELLDLAGSRFVAISEWGERTRLNEGRVKSLTGGDKITARGLHQDPTTFDVTSTLWLPCNHRPIVSADYAVHRRLRFIPFDVQVPEAEQDPAVKEAVCSEIDGIFARAFAGARRYLSDRLVEPVQVSAARAGVREESESFQPWLDESCAIGPGIEARAAALRASYRDWCAANDAVALSNEALTGRLKAVGATPVRRADGVYWLNIALRSEESEMAAAA